jgi:DNA-binding response OmpR family regulator
VGCLRRKLDPDAPASTPIETVRGFGYRYRRPA